MSDIQKRIEELSAKISMMSREQNRLGIYLSELQNELNELKLSSNIESGFQKTAPVSNQQTEESWLRQEVPVKPIPSPIQQQKPLQSTSPKPTYSNKQLEDFIGTNLISKIGILITIIGIFIGAKYAIDKELISPAMRIVLGYVAGAVLIFTALRLKEKYEKFSGVLMGGGLAVIYFITYIGFSFYELFPQVLTFLLMVIVTIATVAIAFWYNQKIIAILGQVGAYAIPFLLSDGSGRVMILFSYISIINIGLLVLSFYKDWKILYRIAFFLTWIIYLAWVLQGYAEVRQFSTGMIFLCINFLTFYSTFLSYKIVKKELYNIGEVVILLVNALLFFFLGTSLINDTFSSRHVLTTFTISNAIIHLAIAYTVYKLKLADRSVFQFLVGLGLLFITIAIPVELDGSWVTLLWTFEATALCYIAFKNDRQMYLVIAIPMIFIAAISLLQDWITYYSFLNIGFSSGEKLTRQPFANLNFYFSLIVCACFGFITWLSYQTFNASAAIKQFFRIILPFIFVFALYFTFFNEIYFAWDQLIASNTTVAAVWQGGDNIIYFRQLSLIIFSCLYVTVLLLVNKRFIKSDAVAYCLAVAGVLCVSVFLLQGLMLIGNLRDNYLALQSRGASPSWLMMGIRYICFATVAVLFLTAYKTVTNTTASRRIFSTLFNITLLAIICNEFVHWMDIAGYQNQYKLGLSLICGVYALVLIFVGITKRQRHLRIASIILFALTLIKLFAYDLSSLSTISKTIVLVILGIILLVVSFLYTKYKEAIFGEAKSPTAEGEKEISG